MLRYPARMDIKFRKAVGNRMRILRGKLGMTQNELAQPLKSSKSTISGYEVGDSSPCLETVAILAELAGVSCDWIIRGGDGAASEPPDDSVLTPEELRLLDAYRTIGRMEQSAVLRIIEGLASRDRQYHETS